MRYLARGILGVVALFVVVVIAIMLIARTRAARVEAVGAAPSSADLHIREVDLEEVTKGVRWRLKAEQALMYEQEGRTTLKRPDVNVYQPDRTWHIVGEEGDLNDKTKDVEVRRNVVVTSSDGMRLDTTVLRWDANAKRLWTDAPVVLSKHGSVVHGTGVSVLVEPEEATIAGRVRATFVPGSAR